jgi:hypothetical protein
LLGRHGKRYKEVRGLENWRYVTVNPGVFLLDSFKSWNTKNMIEDIP